jgi:hydroxymethylpyrimidine pyrophosphatase-like HAD family hydrolase
MSVSATHATANKEREVSSTGTPATIRLLVADVDGTLVTHDKVLTERARAAVAKMRSAGIQFAITSGRPPRGMEMLIAPLALTTPIAAFNGGMFVKPDLSVIEQRVLQADVIEPAMETMRKHGLDSWIYRGTEWFVRDRHGPHVDREEWTVKFPPTVVSNFEGLTNDVAKLVGVSDDLEAVHECETAVRDESSHETNQSSARNLGLSRAFAALLPRRYSPGSEQRLRRYAPVRNAPHSDTANCHHR